MNCDYMNDWIYYVYNTRTIWNWAEHQNIFDGVVIFLTVKSGSIRWWGEESWWDQEIEVAEKTISYFIIYINHTAAKTFIGKDIILSTCEAC